MMNFLIENQDLIVNIGAAIVTIGATLIAIFKAFGSNEKVKQVTAYLEEVKAQVLKESNEQVSDLETKHGAFMEEVLTLLNEKFNLIESNQKAEQDTLNDILETAKVDDPSD